MQRLSPEEFEHATKGSGLRERSLAQARAVLVDGVQSIAAARDFNVSRSRISKIVAEVIRLHETRTGFEHVEAVLPRHQAALVRTWAGVAAQQMESKR